MVVPASKGDVQKVQGRDRLQRRSLETLPGHAGNDIGKVEAQL